MKHYSRVHETDAHYVLHDKRDGKMFHIAKKGIDAAAHEKIKSLDAYDNDQPRKDSIPGTDSQPLNEQPQKKVNPSANPEPVDKRPLSQQPQKRTNPGANPKSVDQRLAEDQPQAYSAGGHVLDANARSHIAPKNFALSDGRYPIEDENHARNALARVSQHGSTEEKAQVRAAVHRKYPGIEMQHLDDGGPVLDPNAVNNFVKGFKGHAEGGKIDEMPHYDEGTPAVQEVNPEIVKLVEDIKQGVNPGAEGEPVNIEGEPVGRQDEEAAAEQAAGPLPSESAPVPTEVEQPENSVVKESTVVPADNVAQKPEVEPKIADSIPEKAALGQSTLEQDLAKNKQDYDNLLTQQQKSDEKYSTLVATQKLDPSRFYNNQNLGQKISMGLGLLLGGIGAGITGGPNQTLEMLNKSIDRDIDAQKNDQSNKINLWKMNHESLRDQQAATLQTRNQILEQAKVKMDELMGTAPGPMAQQRAAALKTQIQSEQMQNQFAITRSRLMQSLLSDQSSHGQAPGTQSPRDPASLVPYLVPQEQQKPVLQEIQDRQNITRNGPKIMQAFDQAVKDKSLTSLKINPASVNALHQLMLPLFKDVDGTVRQAAMDESFKNLTPQLLDSSEKDSVRRQALQDWVTSKAAAPNAKAYGIDLDKYQSTAQQIGGKIFKQHGVTYQLLPDGSAKRVR